VFCFTFLTKSILNIYVGEESDGRSVTVIQLLVDIIQMYNSKESTSNYLKFSEDEKVQELLKKALFAVSAAARGNVDVQNALLVKSNEDSNSNETEKLSSVLLDSLYNISINTNKTNTGCHVCYIIEYYYSNVKYSDLLSMIHPWRKILNKLGYFCLTDVMRKIWSFVYDLLEERQYIRDELTLAANPEDAAVLKGLSLLGDCLLTEKWANLSVFVLFKYFQEFSHLQKMKKESLFVVQGSDKKRYIAMHATLLSVLQCIRLYAQYSQTHIISPSSVSDESVEYTQELFSETIRIHEGKRSLNFFQSVKASLVSLLSTIDVSLADDEAFADVVTEVRDVLKIL